PFRAERHSALRREQRPRHARTPVRSIRGAGGRGLSQAQGRVSARPRAVSILDLHHRGRSQADLTSRGRAPACGRSGDEGLLLPTASIIRAAFGGFKSKRADAVREPNVTAEAPLSMGPSRLRSMLASKATRQFGFAALVISLLILSPIAFHSKSPLVFYRFDGTYLLIASLMQKVWSISDWYFTSNPLQGIGGLELPHHPFI